MRVGGIVLAGGRSRRMGRPKAALPWGPGTLLSHACEVVAEAVDGPVVVVRAPGQELPPVPAGVLLAEDGRPDGGVLVGILAGLEALAGTADAAYVSAVDVPHLAPAFVRRVVAGLNDDTDVVLPDAQGFRHPLAAAYRLGVAAPLERLLDAGGFRPAELYAVVRTRVVDAGWLLADDVVRATDPALRSLENVNDPAAYATAHSVAFPP